jgi:YgiT-type zinc finger domain-containing protein
MGILIDMGTTSAGWALRFQVSFMESDKTKIIAIYVPGMNGSTIGLGDSMFNCHVCGQSDAKTESVSEVFNLEGRRVLVENIPALVCEQCGEPTLSREATERIRAMVHGAETAITTVPMDVFAIA